MLFPKWDILVNVSIKDKNILLADKNHLLIFGHIVIL